MKLNAIISLSSAVAILFSGCNAPSDNSKDDVSARTERSVQDAEPPVPVQRSASTPLDRDEWQRPEVIIGMANSDLTGMVFGDLFAGDGYFTWKLIDAGANVISVDNDPKNIEALQAEKKARGLSDERLKIRAVPVGDPGLNSDEVDVALLVHKYYGILDKPAYFERLRKGMRYPKYLMVVDWQYRETPIGPAMSERTPTNDLMEALLKYGWSDVGAHSDKIPFQVVFFANDPMDDM
ncbi:MAG: class I SAM-dependent methyltransferase [Flavobacteriales bacterium]|nr:class I SAM-dependent methyltransferase [Flavobacteriales bacterium]